MGELVIHMRTPAVVIASQDELVYEIWRSNSDIEGVRAANRQLAACGDRLAGSMVVLSVVTIEGLMQFSDDLRRESIDRLKRIGPKMKAGALTLPTRAFAATMVRSLVSGIFLVFKPTYAFKVCASLGESAEFLSHHVPTMLPGVARDRILSVATNLGGTAQATG